MIWRNIKNHPHVWLLILILFTQGTWGSKGDRLPEFQHCLEVCHEENCRNGDSSIPIFYRFLFWNCRSECDYTCQHIITDQRVMMGKPILQFHGKWPFYRFLGIQEPFSVLFSLMNFLAHRNGLSKIIKNIPISYHMYNYYILFAYSGMTSWVFSMIFHTRDFPLTEQLDYLAAGGSVLYGLFYSPIRVFRMNMGDKKKKSLLRTWTIFCIILYLAHVGYLKLYKWDYEYNILANVVIGITQNIVWSCYSVWKYQKSGKFWATWPGIVVAWILVAMSLELLDFPPLWGCLDAHSLWHLGTVGPTIIWYNFLIKDTQEELAAIRLKS